MLAQSTYQLLSAVATNRPIQVQIADLEDLLQRGYLIERDHHCALTEAGRLAFQYGRQVSVNASAPAKALVG
jgi:hypothetical protein